MKLLIAYIQPEALNDVKQSLYDAEVYKMSVTNAMGCGQQKGYHETYRGADIEVNLLKKVRIEIAVNDEFVEATTDAIIKGARTGNIGDGKIFVLDLPACIRIRTGEKGPEAVG
ncbi:P-II family nitrogen regulator [Verrucomicrobia bacterium S94]|nr:P-II family nitrogen regulator [Verrucomicrobia bacterium S94]